MLETQEAVYWIKEAKSQNQEAAIKMGTKEIISATNVAIL